jgi:AAA+ superfamily predicted ATPase
LGGFVRGAPSEEARGPLVVPPKVERALRALVSRGGGQERALRLWVVGPSGAGKSALAAKLSADEGVAHWEVDSRALLTAPDAEQAARELVREARLAGASLEFAGAKAWLLPEHARSARLLDELLSDHRGRAYFTDEEPAALPAWPSGGPLRLELGPLSVVERAQVWAAHLPYGAVNEGLAHDLARRFVLPPGKIAQAARSAWAEACARGGRRVEPTLEELLRACRQAQGEAVGSLAQRLNQPFGWEDLIAPPKTLAALEEIVRFARQRQRLLEGWGFGRRLAYGRALTALFSGPPGTGKTMAAGIVASELNLDVYRIDLSQLTSHYIGETEKNLKRVFEYARASQSALLFDEADAVFAKRTEVKTSNDRYANMEVNYLLQLMEEFDGVVLLTTNARDSIDAAFLRRIRFKVEFPAPDEQERLRLWRAMLPPEVPTQGDLDLAELAAAYELSGAHIKNVVVRAAISALSQDVPLRMAHLTEAAELEYAELGRLRVSG